MQTPKKERVIVYIDGYNLYFGLKDSDFKRYLWLNPLELVNRILKPNQELIQVNYFTTLVTNNVDSRLRQKIYIGALETIDRINIIFGKFQSEKSDCKVCGNSYYGENEKMTDVGIATKLMIDYFEDSFDMAMIISGDTDLLPPIRYINNSKNKRVFVAFPPDRSNDEVRTAAKGSITIGRKNLADSQFPNVVTNADGINLTRPITWV